MIRRVAFQVSQHQASDLFRDNENQLGEAVQIRLSLHPSYWAML